MNGVHVRFVQCAIVQADRMLMNFKICYRKDCLLGKNKSMQLFEAPSVIESFESDWALFCCDK